METSYAARWTTCCGYGRRWKVLLPCPPGVTAYRKGLFKLTPYDQQSAAETLDIMEEYCARCRKQYGRSVVYPSDEWYLLAGRDVPPAEFYDNYDQLEDGVGMWRMYHDSFWDELQFPRSNVEPRSIDVVTGTLAAPLSPRNGRSHPCQIPADLRYRTRHPRTIILAALSALRAL